MISLMEGTAWLETGARSSTWSSGGKTNGTNGDGLLTGEGICISLEK